MIMITVAIVIAITIAIAIDLNELRKATNYRHDTCTVRPMHIERFANSNSN